MVYQIFFQKLFQNERRRWLFIFSLVALTHFLCQNLMLPYGNALVSLLPNAKIPIHGKDSFSTEHSMAQTARVGNSILSNASDLTINSLHSGHAKNAEISNVDEPSGHDRELKEKNEERDNNFTSDGQRSDDDSDFVEDENIESDVLFEEIADIDEDLPLQNTSTLGKASENRHSISPGQTVEFSDGSFMNNVLQGNKSVMEEEIATTSTALSLSPVAVQPEDSVMNITFLKKSLSNLSILSDGALDNSLAGQQIKDNVHTESHIRLPSVGANSSNGSATSSIPVRKKMRCEMPPKSITSIYEMNRLLVRNRARSRAMRPRWSSVRDQEIISAKLQIEGAPILKSDRELYAPLFRNISMFKRSYEIMERMLKIYVYKEGEKPIFHQPILKGLYASEGWFMKLLEGNKQFSVKDPRKAHLFYMPFSARMLEHTLYVRNSHNRTNLRQYLKNYAEKIAEKYRFWNRTGGADHFLVACHDWAPYETRHHMEHCMKALCNADVTQAFKIGRDVSLPETYVRSARNPLRDLGGKPPSDRHILAFYAGNIHGYLRPILLKHWKNKDPNMKIFGPMPPGVASKMNYIQHMKSSKYCICPKGYEVNSPRVVEAIFYECVPVIISDNFVPPFFEVLNWDAFSVIIAEKDIPKLKDILLSIPKERYLEMQQGVRKVQKHFLWHPKPMKYDLFHMTLHSIWYNRVFQFKAR